MKKIYLCFILPAFLLLGACHDDDSYKQNIPGPQEPATISVMLTSRVGSVVGNSLSEYVGALNLLLFRANNAGDFILYRQKVLNQEQLRALSDSDQNTEAGFTVFKEISFDTVPVADYRIVGVGNVLDSLGNAQPSVSLQGATIGTSITNVLTSVRNGDEAPRLFWGMTETIHAGSGETMPVLRLYRKISMFALTVLIWNSAILTVLSIWKVIILRVVQLPYMISEPIPNRFRIVFFWIIQCCLRSKGIVRQF